jgi:hypothetical protein
MNKYRVAVELWSFIRERKKFIFLPIILMLVLMTLFVLFAEVPVLTPFIYALF